MAIREMRLVLTMNDFGRGPRGLEQLAEFTTIRPEKAEAAHVQLAS